MAILHTTHYLSCAGSEALSSSDAAPKEIIVKCFTHVDDCQYLCLDTSLIPTTEKYSEYSRRDCCLSTDTIWTKIAKNDWGRGLQHTETRPLQTGRAAPSSLCHVPTERPFILGEWKHEYARLDDCLLFHFFRTIMLSATAQELNNQKPLLDPTWVKIVEQKKVFLLTHFLCNSFILILTKFRQSIDDHRITLLSNYINQIALDTKYPFTSRAVLSADCAEHYCQCILKDEPDNLARVIGAVRQKFLALSSIPHDDSTAPSGV